MNQPLVGLGTQAQIVTYDAARRLLEKTERFDRPIDVYLQLRWKHGVRILTLWPNGVREHSSKNWWKFNRKRKNKSDKLRRELYFVHCIECRHDLKRVPFSLIKNN